MSTWNRFSISKDSAAYIYGNGSLSSEMDAEDFQGVHIAEAGGELKLSSGLAAESPAFRKTWKIYCAAFPRGERRSLLDQKWIMRNPRYRFSAMMVNGQPVGALAFWLLDGFCYVEHIAVAGSMRSRGIGARALGALESALNMRIVLDVEPFGSSLQASRRIAFYTRLGYAYSPKSVVIPAYPGQPDAATDLMSWPAPLSPAERAAALASIDSRIYGVDIETQPAIRSLHFAHPATGNPVGNGARPPTARLHWASALGSRFTAARDAGRSRQIRFAR